MLNRLLHVIVALVHYILPVYPGGKKGDLVWTSPISFVASSNCALYCQADVDFVDIDSETNNMSVESLEEKLKSIEKRVDFQKLLYLFIFRVKVVT